MFGATLTFYSRIEKKIKALTMKVVLFGIVEYWINGKLGIDVTDSELRKFSVY